MGHPCFPGGDVSPKEAGGGGQPMTWPNFDRKLHENEE